MGNKQLESGSQRVDIEYRLKKNKEEMRHQVISFALMIILTILAFVAVGTEAISPWFTIPIILVMACVQVGFQLYYFMHMSHKGHEAVQLYIYTGALIGFVTVLCYITIIWW